MKEDEDPVLLPAEHWLTPAEAPAAVGPIIEAVRSGGDLKAAIGAAVRSLGFEWFAFAQAQRDPRHPEATFTTWGNVPAAWIQTYRDRQYGVLDPRPRAAARSAIPEIWDRTCYPDTAELREFFDTAATFGICSGVVMVMNQPDPSCTEFFSVTSPRPVIDNVQRQAIALTMGDLWAIGAYGHELLPGATLAGEGQAVDLRPLRPRELECLTLAAHGATSRAIAEKLGISERTVNAHIERAIRKCGAKNRQEAVARAINSGLIPF